MSHALTPQSLTPEAFAPFGTVLQLEGAETRLINEGGCTRFHALARIETLGEGAQAVVNLFRAEPAKLPLRLGMMERHPLGSQSFWPLSGSEWLVAVAPDEDGRPGAPVVFRARPDQGVCYRPNVWHHPLLALGATSDFLVVDRDGSGVNLEEVRYVAAYEVGP